MNVRNLGLSFEINAMDGSILRVNKVKLKEMCKKSGAKGAAQRSAKLQQRAVNKNAAESG